LIENTYDDNIFVIEIWLLLLKQLSSALLVPEKGAHWLFWCVWSLASPLLLLWFVRFGFGSGFTYKKT